MNPGLEIALDLMYKLRDGHAASPSACYFQTLIKNHLSPSISLLISVSFRESFCHHENTLRTSFATLQSRLSIDALVKFLLILVSGKAVLLLNK